MMVGFSSSATEDELKAAWMYLEWMCNDDVLFTMQYGIEGENFNYNEDGLPVSVADYSGDYKQGYNSTGAVRQHLRQQVLSRMLSMQQHRTICRRISLRM